MLKHTMYGQNLIIFFATFAIEIAASFNVEVIQSPKTLVGTRAHWDVENQSLYYCDVYGNESSILRYDYNDNKVYTTGIDGEYVVPFIIPIVNSNDKYAVGLGKRVGIVRWDGKTSKATLESIAFEVDSEKNENRFNAAKADPSCRFYGGTMISENVPNASQIAAGKVFKYEKVNGVNEVLDNIYISNGMAWDKHKNKFYYIDSRKFDVKEYDYEPNTGNIFNERVVVDYSINGTYPGFLPDGLTIDTDGNLYVTFFSGSKIHKIDPKSGKVLLEIIFPVKQVTAVAFGGPNLNVLYVTTASIDDTESELAGCLFKVTGLGVKGFPGDNVCI